MGTRKSDGFVWNVALCLSISECSYLQFYPYQLKLTSLWSWTLFLIFFCSGKIIYWRFLKQPLFNAWTHGATQSNLLLGEGIASSSVHIFPYIYLPPFPHFSHFNIANLQEKTRHLSFVSLLISLLLKLSFVQGDILVSSLSLLPYIYIYIYINIYYSSWLTP